MFPWNKKKGGGLDNRKIMYSTVQYSFISLYFHSKQPDFIVFF